ncbi:uncharacterized protein EURHEDRAFT_528835, partial [Aspergillus ruber CBS 135680]
FFFSFWHYLHYYYLTFPLHFLFVLGYLYCHYPTDTSLFPVTTSWQQRPLFLTFLC